MGNRCRAGTRAGWRNLRQAAGAVHVEQERATSLLVAREEPEDLRFDIGVFDLVRGDARDLREAFGVEARRVFLADQT